MVVIDMSDFFFCFIGLFMPVTIFGWYFVLGKAL